MNDPIFRNLRTVRELRETHGPLRIADPERSLVGPAVLLVAIVFLLILWAAV